MQVVPCETDAVRVVVPPAVGRLAGDALNELALGSTPFCVRCTDLLAWWLPLLAFRVRVKCRIAVELPTWKLNDRCPDEQLWVFGKPARCGEMLTLQEAACLTTACRCTVPPLWPTGLGDNVSEATFGFAGGGLAAALTGVSADVPTIAKVAATATAAALDTRALIRRALGAAGRSLIPVISAPVPSFSRADTSVPASRDASPGQVSLDRSLRHLFIPRRRCDKDLIKTIVAETGEPRFNRSAWSTTPTAASGFTGTTLVSETLHVVRDRTAVVGCPQLIPGGACHTTATIRSRSARSATPTRRCVQVTNTHC